MNELNHNQQLGALGEEMACRWLTEMDYRLLARNWRVHHMEVDIIADDCGEIVFVEVKTRTHEGYYTAKGAVDKNKKELIIAAAKIYMRWYYPDLPYRFDVITVTGEEEERVLTHYKNAYSKRKERVEG